MQEPTPVQPGPPFGNPPVGVYSPPPAPQKSGISKFVWIGCAGGCLLAVIAVAVGVFGLGYFGLGVFAEQVANDLRSNPVVVEHLGTIQELEVDLMASSAVADQNIFVFDAKGAKGQGRIRAECVTIDGGTEDVVSGTLEMSTGEVYDLFPNPGTEVEAEP